MRKGIGRFKAQQCATPSQLATHKINHQTARNVNETNRPESVGGKRKCYSGSAVTNKILFLSTSQSNKDAQAALIGGWEDRGWCAMLLKIKYSKITCQKFWQSNIFL